MLQRENECFNVNEVNNEVEDCIVCNIKIRKPSELRCVAANTPERHFLGLSDCVHVQSQASFAEDCIISKHVLFLLLQDVLKQIFYFDVPDIFNITSNEAMQKLVLA